MTFVSYAQNFEDVRLWRAFSDVEEGRYLDIGAQEPVRDSVSYAFYLRGWRGVHVEATPTYAAALRAARPDELVIEAAASSAPGPITFFEIPETGLSTGIADLAKRHAEAGWAERAIAVPTVTLAGLFDLMGEGPIHWLKIDVEGMEADVLESWGDHPARPAALVIEVTAPNTQIQVHGAWYDLVIGRDYHEVLFDGLSRYFVHKSHAHRGEALALSPNVFDGFKVPEAHFTAGLIVTERDARQAAERAQAAAEYHSLAEASATELAAARAEATAAHQSLAEASAVELAGAKAEAAVVLAAAQAKADAEIGLARAEVQHTQVRLADQAEAHGAMLAQVRAAFEAQLAAAETALADVRGALASQHQHNAALAREAGRLEGELTAQAVAYAARMDDAEAVRRDLAERLATSEKALASAHDGAIGLHRQIQSLIAEHAQALTDARVSLAQEIARAGALSSEIATLAQRLADSEAGRELAARQLDEARQQGEAQAAALHSEAERLRAHIAWREGQLAQAVALLVPPDPLAGWPRRVANLLAGLAGRRPLDVAADHAAAVAVWQAALATSDGNEVRAAHLSCAGNETIAIADNGNRGFDMLESDEPITSVPRLLAPHDEDFIWAAYQALLGRAPDPEGAAYYLTRLRAGTHKLTILKQLRRSPEGREFIPGVAGLDRAIRRHRRANLPLVGPFIRLMTGEPGNSATHRQLRVIENEIGRLRSGQAALSDAIAGFCNKPMVPILVPPVPAAPPQAPAAPPPATAVPPSLAIGDASAGLDSAERRLLGTLRLFARTRGA